MREMIKILVLFSLLLLSACSPQNAAIQRNPSAGYHFRHSDFDYKVAWKTSESHNVVFIDGILKNVRYANIDGLDLTVFLVGMDGTIRSRATTLPSPQQSKVNEVVSFNAKLQNVTLDKGDTFKFVINYQGSDGGVDGGIDGHGSFAVDAITGIERATSNLKVDDW